jgi:hypothetical protein
MAVPACPLCGWQPPSFDDRCARCDGDLRPLRAVAELGDRHFNEAVTLARRRRWREAAEHLAVTLALAPDDVEALVLLGKVRLRQKGGTVGAVAALERARELARPGSAVETTVAALLAAAAPRPAPRQPGKLGRRRQR